MTARNSPPLRPARPPRRGLDWAARRAGMLLRRIMRQPRALVAGFLLGSLAVLIVQQWAGPEVPALFVPAALDAEADITVVLSEGLLTALVRQSVEQGESPITLEDIQVETDSGRVRIHGSVPLPLGSRVNGQVEMEPLVEEGNLRLEVRRARLGPLSAPRNLERLAEGPINRQVAASLRELPATITSARADSDGLTVTARVRTEELPAAPR